MNGKERVFHLIPSGITQDARGVVNVLGNGMVIDLGVLNEELNELDKEGLSYKHLMISEDAHVIMPYHVARDKARNQSQSNGGVGSTGRGIGPAYADKISRRGIVIRDLFNRDVLTRKILKAAEAYPEQRVNADEVIGLLNRDAERIKPFVRDSVAEMHNFHRAGKRILLEGAQGLLLSIEHGTYPYVTSSDCSINGTASGVGLSAASVDRCFGIVKFPFMTRVGAGPFPTEFGGSASESYCAQDGHRKADELKEYGIPFEETDGKIKYDSRDSRIVQLINSEDAFVRGIGVRLAAGEYGATTGRPRRTGWTDAVAARYAVGINGPLMILTKVDALPDIREFKICHSYEGRDGSFSRDADVLRAVKPVYQSYPGYGDVRGAREARYLSSSLRAAISDFEKFTGGNIAAVSTGAERDDTIVL